MGKTIVSKQFQIKFRDVARGIIIAVLTPVLFVIQQSLDAGQLTLNWKAIAIAALSGGIAYLIKNFLEPTKVITKGDTNEPLGI